MTGRCGALSFFFVFVISERLKRQQDLAGLFRILGMENSNFLDLIHSVEKSCPVNEQLLGCQLCVKLAGVILVERLHQFAFRIAVFMIQQNLQIPWAKISGSVLRQTLGKRILADIVTEIISPKAGILLQTEMNGILCL